MLDSIRPKKRTIFLYLLLPVIIYAFTVFVPLVAAFVFSFFEWKGGPVKTFNGWENYITLLHDSDFWHAFGNNLYLVVACLIGQIGIAFIMVLLINSRLAKTKSLHRTLDFFPSTISAVCIGMIWTMVYHNKYGILNWFLTSIGRADLCQVWLNNTQHIMLIVTIPLIWQFIGYYMIILFSAIAGIDREVFESAEIDGANAVQTALSITLPLIKNTMLVCVTLCIAGNMKAFDNIYVMTKGGPGTASMVMALYGYKISFEQSNMGYGSSISVGIFVLSLLVIGGSQWLIKKISKRAEVQRRDKEEKEA